MSREEILNAIKNLAKSQGSYGRLLEQIEQNDRLLDVLENQNFNDALDMVMWLES